MDLKSLALSLWITASLAGLAWSETPARPSPLKCTDSVRLAVSNAPTHAAALRAVRPENGLIALYLAYADEPVPVGEGYLPGHLEPALAAKRAYWEACRDGLGDPFQVTVSPEVLGARVRLRMAINAVLGDIEADERMVAEYKAGKAFNVLSRLNGKADALQRLGANRL